MSDTTNRQAYVFLDCRSGSKERTEEGDERYDYHNEIWESVPGGDWAGDYTLIRRPITLPTEQTDNSAIVSALVSKVALIATIVDKMRDEMLDNKEEQPAEQPRETCRWKHLGYFLYSPHDESYVTEDEATQDCPTCGKKIEVVE